MRAYRFARTALLLTLLWALLSGEFDAFHLGLGGLSAGGIAALRTGPAKLPPFPALRILAYAPWLMGQILLSNLRVARLALSPRLRLSPQFVEVPPDVRGDVPLTVLGCSITLTPGTVTLDADDRLLSVHALDEASAAEIREGVISARVRALFRQEAPG